MAETNNGSETPANQTIYINNLNEKIKLDELKKSLHAVFSQFGKILEVLAFKTVKHKGQAWVVFEDVSSASNALRQMQGFPFYDKPMRIQYAKTKSDVIAKADGTFVPREKRKRHEEKGKKRKDQHDGTHAGAAPPVGTICRASIPSLNLLFSLLGAGQRSRITHPVDASPAVAEAPDPPNNILFVQNLPQETTPMMLQMLFCQYPGFKEVRMVETKPGIAFVEYGNEMQSTVAMQALLGFKMTQQNSMLITYAKK